VPAATWYLEVAGPSLADAFELELDAAVRLLMRFPGLGTPGPRGTRSLRLDRFPYSVCYRVGVDEIMLVALAHHRRRPGYWRKRSVSR